MSKLPTLPPLPETLVILLLPDARPDARASRWVFAFGVVHNDNPNSGIGRARPLSVDATGPGELPSSHPSTWKIPRTPKPSWAETKQQSQAK